MYKYGKKAIKIDKIGTTSNLLYCFVMIPYNYAPNFEKVGSILLSACVSVCESVCASVCPSVCPSIQKNSS